ncbi:MAG TPA: aminotransferase class I/II-fold pyridoxal phosphate-dependent enzyme [Anaerolineae bacterium]|nr:aminotransferase class I/II-fold pyridoxal phosphate-dependent enzyme [Anaerolineae bacterium]
MTSFVINNREEAEVKEAEADDQRGKLVLGVGTRSVHAELGERQANEGYGLVGSVVQTATYTFESTADLCAYMEAKMWGGAGGRVEYARYGNPTVQRVEKRIAHLEEGEAALLFPSGMTAITNILLSILPTNSHVIYTDDCYSKTRDFCRNYLRRLGIESTQVSMGDYEALAGAIQANTRVIISESPTNPYLRVADLERIAAIGREHSRIKTIIDATFATPINQRPLTLGIDLVVHSATKYLSGHNDILAGVVVGEAGLIHALRRSQGVLGGVLDPHAAFLLERGLKTLALRVKQQNRSAQLIAEYLERHPKIERVWYPGLASHPDYEVARAQMEGYGGVVSFEVGAAEGEDKLTTAGRLIDNVQIPYIAASLGGVESLIEQPALMSYYDLSTEERLEIGIRDNLVRLAVGIEETDDLLADLEQALAQL